MLKFLKSTLRPSLLSLAAYLTVIAVIVGGIPIIAPGPRRWMALGFLVLFGLLISFSPEPEEPGAERRTHVFLAVETMLVAILLTLEPGVYPTSIFFCILFFILSAMAMRSLPERIAVLWILVFALVTGVALILGWGWDRGVRSFLAFSGGYFFFGVFANALRKAEIARRESAELLAELQAAHRKLQEYASQAETLAVAEERNRVAREMHDTLGHRLTVAAVQLEGAERLIPRDPERAAEMIHTVREQVREGLAELRRTVAALRLSPEVDVALPVRLTRLAVGFGEATGVTVHLALPDPSACKNLPGPHRLVLYRTAQEGLTNVQRHAGAGQVWLEMDIQNEAARLLVGDDGRGCPPKPEPEGFGLHGLRERAAQLGGTLDLEPRPGGGTQLRVTLPVPKETTDG